MLVCGTGVAHPADQPAPLSAAPRPQVSHALTAPPSVVYVAQRAPGGAFTCTTQGQVLRVYEWAVQNATAVLSPGYQTLVTPSFVSAHPLSPKLSMWMRISIAEAPAPLADGALSRLADGRGPRDGYAYGETADYPLSLCPTCAALAYQGE